MSDEAHGFSSMGITHFRDTCMMGLMIFIFLRPKMSASKP